ncbi:MAG: Fe-S cluster assembly ATPase SufC [Candidatus Palauibacterales bacterium]|nr:Fe-S cluster assembly ATPase SufC [Candidatus Palauibacterales bacterium]
MADKLLEVRDLHVTVEDEDIEILKGVDLEVDHGEIHALMGPNGSGKSTLAKLISGHPSFIASRGEVLYEGDDVLEMEPDERARAGVFMAFQYPSEIPGVSISNFLRTAINAGRDEEDEISVFDFRKRLKDALELLDMDESFADRYVNDGFSGGEKKRNEILQMAVLQPTLALLDETDSGLDIDALKVVADGVNRIGDQNQDLGVLLITHYQRILNYIEPDRVHVMIDGKIVESGGPELAEQLEEQGYDWLREEKEPVSA